MTRLNEAVKFTTQQQAQKSYFDSHPYTPERGEHVNQWATQFSNAFAPPADGEFVQELDGLLLGSNPDKGVFVEDDY
ncbi:peptidase, partial [Vibrio campbellii]